MRKRKSNIDRVTIERATNNSNNFVRAVEETVRKVHEDPDKERRMDKQHCKSCYYVRGKMGGAAMTVVQCSFCDDDMTFSSTYTDYLCVGCAKDNDLCAHCGGDIDMKIRRKSRKYESKKK